MSDSDITIQYMKERIRKFCEERNWDQFHDPKELAIGAVTEASELLDLFRFNSKEDMEKMMKDPVYREKIGAEMVDTVYSILRLAQRYDFDLSDEFEKKMKKNEEKYPVEKAKNSNKKYSE